MADMIDKELALMLERMLLTVQDGTGTVGGVTALIYNEMSRRMALRSLDAGAVREATIANIKEKLNGHIDAETLEKILG
jgi:hypothetical protein